MRNWLMNKQRRNLMQEKTGIQNMGKNLQKKNKEETPKKNFYQEQLQIKTAMNHSDMAKVHVAQGMIEGLKKVGKDLEEEKKETEKMQTQIDKMKTSLITQFLVKD
ncbi:hypothetical protein PR048_008215 [Dryococelus australis]|uniref:Uncharacterized protein n=1 Tax=Dryococelus australis TaxID=614101 RepID=A0ABQ9HWG8_9NEOP|nr:hypothetical protein PR048_008215 [Dryococelus australis]